MYTGCSIWSETGVESGLWFGCFTVLSNCTTTSAKFPFALGNWADGETKNITVNPA